MSTSQAESLRLLLSLLPPGVRELYDLENTDAHVYNFFDGLAHALRVHGFDVYDDLRDEIFPSRATDRLTDWEAALALGDTRTTLDGTTAQRRNQVVSKLREWGASTIPNIQGSTAPHLGYASNLVRVIEGNRVALQALHTYTTAGTSPIGAMATVSRGFTVLDDGDASQAGARVTFTISHTLIQEISLHLTSPDSVTTQELNIGTWTHDTGSVTSQTYTVWFSDVAGGDMLGTWVFDVENTGAGSGNLYDCSIFVEGIGIDASYRNKGRAAAMFEWGVFVDPTRVTYSSVDFDALRATIRRLNPGHCIGTVVRGSETVSPGTPLAIPDDPTCIPDDVIPTDGAWPNAFSYTTAAAVRTAAATRIEEAYDDHPARRAGRVAYVRVP